MWCQIRCWSAPDSRKADEEDQPRTAGWGNVSHITRLPLTTATYFLVQCRCKISLPLIHITRLPPATTRYTRTTKYAQVLLYFTNYHIHDYGDFRTMQQDFRWIKTAHQEDIYRPKKRCTWTGSTNRTNLTKDTVKRHKSIKEDTSMKEQYSRTSIFGRIYQHRTTHERATFTLNHHHTTTSDSSRLPENMTRSYIRVLFYKRTRIYDQGLQGTYPQKKFSVFPNNIDSRPSNFLFQIARGSGATLSECA